MNGGKSGRRPEILSGCPAEHREWLGEKLRYSNEVSLRSRVRQMYDEQPENVQKLLEKKKQFVEDVTTTRNSLTHHSPELEGSAPYGLDLWRLIKNSLNTASFIFEQYRISDNDVAIVIKKSRDYIGLC